MINMGFFQRMLGQLSPKKLMRPIRSWEARRLIARRKKGITTRRAVLARISANTSEIKRADNIVKRHPNSRRTIDIAAIRHEKALDRLRAQDELRRERGLA